MVVVYRAHRVFAVHDWLRRLCTQPIATHLIPRDNRSSRRLAPNQIQIPWTVKVVIRLAPPLSWWPGRFDLCLNNRLRRSAKRQRKTPSLFRYTDDSGSEPSGNHWRPRRHWKPIGPSTLHLFISAFDALWNGIDEVFSTQMILAMKLVVIPAHKYQCKLMC